MTFTRMLTAAIIAAGAATALAAPAAAEELTQEQFLAAIAEHGVQVGTDEEAIKLAERMCKILGNGSDEKIEKAVYYIKDHSKLSNEGITTFAGIAARVYCPDALPS
ncbi:DUF732 domain-containing protein [Mycolicibacterium bacteremicum]|uniref:DUF732 domain-containing protein n=1 Tax=Mycolicibacterium bacteremicum TaxID=564198 RepID=A0A1W9YWX4_MYCBA|nr:DUF732 domain-containing protein [Mycolicibacterium bacteremicum]MCV7430438.1 DUF732 domain-containing protein [Mycolicibacterium bacteremicum]ORA04260.1 hypothetical protein BST17_15390 [Mycolicibacterium bacteremicum]